MEIPQDFNKYIPEIILIVFGYRMVQKHMFTESPEVKEEQVKRLQKIYEMRDHDITKTIDGGKSIEKTFILS
jgi:hypothetical protein